MWKSPLRNPSKSPKTTAPFSLWQVLWPQQCSACCCSCSCPVRTVYEATGKGNEYSKCGKLCLNVRKPELRIDRLKNVPEGMIAVEIDQKTAEKLFGQNISILYYDSTLTHTVGTVNGPYWFKLDVGAAPDEDQDQSEVENA